MTVNMLNRLKHQPAENLIIDITSEPATVSLLSNKLNLNPEEPPFLSRLSVRVFDIISSLVLLLVTFPLFIIIFISIKLTSSGPSIYRSKRVAYRKPYFNLYKFRSMDQNADRILIDLMSDDEVQVEYKRYAKIKKDPRITSVGSFLRKTSLDELPQLINVLKGDMSLVGPRPKSSDEIVVFSDTLPTILRVKPGITGLWQVSGRNKITLEERVMLDVEYATHRSTGKDIIICLRTAKQMVQLASNGSY